jgi:uncharacterized protein HemX
MDYAPKAEHAKNYESDEEKGISKIAIAAIVVAALAVVFAGWMLVQNRQLQKKQTADTSAKAEVTNEEVAKKVAAVYDAPKETPSVAKVADKSKLPNEAFFQNAKQGDYVLIYPNAKIALIYRLAENKVVNIGPISTN